MSASYAAAINDETLLDLREPIALLEAALQQTAERVSSLDTPDFRARAWRLLEEVRQAMAERDNELAAAKMVELRTLLRDGVAEDQAVDRMVQQAERLARRVEVAWGIKLQKQQVMSIQQLGAVMGRVLEIVAQEASPATASAIIRRMESEVLQLPSGDAASEQRP